MTDLDRVALGDMARYNPHLLSRDELVGLFSARQKTLDRLLDDLTRCGPDQTPQHHLLIAQRGMGKTMLLRRLQIAIEADPTLSTTWLPLTFPEEQYDVGGLSDLWLNSVDALGDTLELLGRKTEADQLDAARDSLLHLEERQRAREALALLLDTARGLGRRLVLLVDNIDLILDRITDQAWALREVLSEERSLLLIGASAQALESTYRYGQPFYDFFQVHELRGLNLEETRAVLGCYAQRWGNEEVSRIIEEEPSRIKTLHTLTGGNPRTITLLYGILARGLDGDVRSDLEALLDQCTPLYKARLEALPAQRQRIVHSLATHWHPATASLVAEDLHLEVNAVSSQLSRLVRDGVVEKILYEPESKTGFQLSERFFNLWYLMRSTRGTRQRLVWFLDFLGRLGSPSRKRDEGEGPLEDGGEHSLGDRLRSADDLFPRGAHREDEVREASPWNSHEADVDLDNLAWARSATGGREPKVEQLAGQAQEAVPGSHEIAHTLACILAAQGKSSAAFERIEGFLEEVAEDRREGDGWPDVVSFFAACVEGGKAREAVDLLERLGLAERWAPLKEALEAVDYGSPKYLRRLAPEVRQPVEEILLQLGWGERLEEDDRRRPSGKAGAGAKRSARQRRKK